MPPVTLVDELRHRDDAALAALLRVRPDLGVPPPSDLTVLATRAELRVSVHRACEQLDTVALAALTALVVAEADAAPVPVADVARLLGPDVREATLAAALDELVGLALAWPSEDGLRCVPAVREVAGLHPGGLGRPVAALNDPADLAARLAQCGPDERQVLEALSGPSPIGRSAQRPAGGPVARLVDRGLLLRVDANTVELPRQLAFALRGERPLGPVTVRPPALPGVRHGPARIDGTAADAALLALRQMERLLMAWSAEPPGVLRSGGLGVRELRRLARQLAADEPRAALLVEVAVAAGLVGHSGGSPPEWVPTTQADPWLVAAPEHRWPVLVSAWLELPRLPALVGRRDEADRPIAALSDALRRRSAPADRRRVLELLAGLPPGDGLASVEDVVALSAWRAPRRGGRLRDELVRWTVAEATALGMIALDGLAGAGRAMLSDGAGGAAVAALRAALPAPVDHVLLQADLTAVAPGRLAPDLAAELALLAEVESAGGATVYRITEASLRRAMDAGRNAAELRETLRRHSATGVPQALKYLVDDVARQHGRLRGGSAGSFLRAEDEVLLTEVLSHPASAVLRLRRIAPTVLVTPLPLAELMDGLATAGFAAAAENAAGAVIDLRSPGRRIPARPRPAYSAMQSSPDRAVALVARIRAGEAMAGSLAGAGRGAANGSSATLALLRRATAERRPVWLGYVDPAGVARDLTVEPVRVDGGVLEGVDRVDGDLRRFLLHRITSVTLVD